MKTNRRKIIQNGPSSLSVSLPSSWIKKHNINKGDNIDIVQKDELLEIKLTHNENITKEKEISFININQKSTKEDIILSLYKKNYDKIKIKYESNQTSKEIYSLLHKLNIGYEIIDQTPTHIIIKNLSSPSKEEFENLLKRAFKITLQYSSKISAIIQNQEDITTTCLLHQETLKKITNYCERINIQLNKEEEGPLIHSLIQNLKEITSSLTQLLKEIRNNENNTSQKIINIFTSLNIKLNKTINLYYIFSISDYTNLKQKLKETSKELENIKTNNTEHTCTKNTIKRIQKDISNLLENILILKI